MAKFSQGPRFSTSSGSVKLDPRLLDILQTAASAYGLDVQATSGVAGRSTGTKNHPGGYAIDVQLVDPSTGKALPNYHQNVAGNFKAYEGFAQTARLVQQQKYPELDGVFRWGGYFAGGPNPADLMHFDINPKLHGAMSGGSWNGGATGAFKKAWGITEANPGLSSAEGQRRASVVRQTIAGGPTPPADIPQAPSPMPGRPASLDAPVPLPRSRPTDITPQLTADNGLRYLQRSGITPDAKLAAARSSHEDLGLGALADPRTSALLAPANSNGTLTALGNAGVSAPLRALGTPAVPNAGILTASGTATAMPSSVGAAGTSTLTAQAAPPGMIAPGNIDLNNRPVYFGNDGTYGTERSFSIGTDKGEVLIPQIVGGKLVSQQQAIDHYLQTGENLGTFASPQAADAYATRIHLRDQGLGNMPVPMPGRPADVQVASAPQPMPGRPSFDIQPPPKALVRLSSGQMIEPGNYPSSDGNHTLTISDDGTGRAKIVKQTNLGEIPGVIDPMRELGNKDANGKYKTVAGKIINTLAPAAIGEGVSAFQSSAPNAIGGVQKTANDALTAINEGTDQIAPVKQAKQAVADAYSGLTSRLGSLFGGGQAAPVGPVLGASGNALALGSRASGGAQLRSLGTVAPTVDETRAEQRMARAPVQARPAADAPVPQSRPAALSVVSSAPRAASVTSQSNNKPAAQTSAPSRQQTITGSATGRSYVVGQTYSNGNGSYVAQANGTFKKVA